MTLLNPHYRQCIADSCVKLPTVVIQGKGYRGRNQFTVQVLSCDTKEHINTGYDLVQKEINPHTPEIIESPPKWLLEQQQNELANRKGPDEGTLIGQVVGDQGIRIGRLRRKER